jgi:hypothetical protein
MNPQADAIAQLLLTSFADDPLNFLIANPLAGLLIKDAEPLHVSP